MRRTTDRMTRRPPTTFRELVDTHMRSLYRLAFELTRSHHDAEDLSQEVFLKVYRSFDDFREDSEIETWLYRITVNTYLNTRRKRMYRFTTLRADMTELFTGSSGDDVARDADAATIRECIDRAMKVLSLRERTAFVLRCEHRLSIRDTAAAMGVAEGTVKSLQHRAVQKLQAGLAFLNPNR